MGTSLKSVNAAWQPAMVRSLREATVTNGLLGLVRAVELYIFFSFTSIFPVLTGLSFLSAESNSVFIHSLFFPSHRLLESPSSRAALSTVDFCRAFQHLSAPIFDIKQTWGTSFGTSTPVLSLSLRAFVSPTSPSGPPASSTNHCSPDYSCLREYLQIPSGPGFGALSGASFFGISLGERCETQEGCSEFILLGYFDPAPDLIGR